MKIEGDTIRLDAFLKLTGLVDTGGLAKVVTQAGEVTVNGEVCLMRTKKLHTGDTVGFGGKTETVE